MESKQEGTIAIAAALIALFAAMLDPWISVAVSATALVLLGIYKLRKK